MKRDIFIEDLIERIKEVPISEVFKLYNIEIFRSGSGYNCYSPFRDNASKTSFTLSDDLGIFKDWVLPDCAGDSIKFVSLLLDISYFEAIFELGLALDLITENEYQKYYKRRRYRNSYKDNLEKKHNRQKKDIKFRPKANIEDLNKVYNIFISKCKLSDKHKSYLKEKRDLSDSEIKDRQFFTFPSRYILRGFLKDIEEEYGNTDILRDIPGFYRRINEERYTFNRYTGIGIPIKDAYGRIEGIQVRLDDKMKNNDNRYFWFSSSFAINDPKKKSVDGTSVGSPLSVEYPSDMKYNVLFITEGVFKAIKIAETYNSIAISVQGVGNWKNINATIKNIEDIKGIKFHKVYIAYDADMRYNFAVYKQASKLGNHLSINNEDIYYVLWNEEYGKGIDDMINEGKGNTVGKLNMPLYDDYMNRFEKYLLKKYNQSTVFNIEKSIVKEEYYKTIKW